MSFIVAGCVLLLALLASVLVDDLPRAAPGHGSQADRQDHYVQAE